VHIRWYVRILKKAEDNHSSSRGRDSAAAGPNTSTRREFLRTSIYAAYATPLITALLVEEASAAPSCTARMQRRCDRLNCGPQWCQQICDC
jgi:hypothetical protein